MKLAYQAWDSRGRQVNDVIDAPSELEAKDSLRRRGLWVTRIGEAAGGRRASDRAAPARRARGGGTRLKMLSNFCRQLYVMIKTGTPIVEALEGVQRQVRDARMKQVIADVRRRVEDGVSLSEALESHPEYFDPVSRSLVAAGETAGKLPTMLERISTLARKQATVRSHVIGAMIYPCLLICVSLSVLILMLTFVLPRFGILFEEQDIPLPPSTAVLMDLSTALRGHWYLFVGGAALAIVALVMMVRSPAGKRVIDTALLRLPGVNAIVRNFTTAKISRLMGILLDSYLPLIDVIGLVRQSMPNTHYQDLMAKSEKFVIHGEPMSKAFADERLINPTVYEALRNGEDSGQIAPLMLTISDFLDEENEVVVRSLTSILEPVILIFLGLLVGFVAISMFLPLFDLTASAGGG